MLRSMTGYGQAEGSCGPHRITVEVRSVNHRYLDIQFKIPDDMRRLEARLREIVSARTARGKTECRIRIQNTGPAGDQPVRLNRALAGQLAEINRTLRKEHKDLGKLTVADILHFPGVLAGSEENMGETDETVIRLLGEAVVQFDEARQREGAQLQQYMLARLKDAEDVVEALMQLFPHLLQAHIEAAQSRLREAVEHADNDRMQQEFVLFMQKADVDEELSRLRAHIAEVRRLVTASRGSIGKRLDFLMQELNREANTLGSKSIAAECTQASVGLKVLIEQMREQVQNIE